MNALFVFKQVVIFFYYQELIEELCVRGHHVGVVFDPDTGGEASSLEEVGFEAPIAWDFSSGLAVDRSGMAHRFLSIARSMRSHLNYFQRSEQSRYYLTRSRNWLPVWLRRLVRVPLVRPLLGSALGMRLLELPETLIPPNPAIVRELRERSPDILIASPANRPGWIDAEYMKAAKALGIPTAISTLSWDNLTTKGMFPVHPDLMLVWNEHQRWEAQAYQRLADQRIVLTGSLFFDKWLDTPIEPGDRDVFIREIGLPKDSRYAVYLGSTRNVAPGETTLVRTLARAMREHPDPQVNSIFLVVRPHPSNVRAYEHFEEDGTVVWPREGMLPTTQETKASFVKTLKHSIGSIGINTSAMIDSIVNDVPVIAIVSGEYKRTQEDTVHFQQLRESAVLEDTISLDGCVDALRRLLNGEDRCEAARARFASEFVRPRGGRPVRLLVADALEMTAAGASPTEVDRALGDPNS